MSEHITELQLAMANQPLDRSTVLSNPIAQFRVWYDQAAEADLFQVNAMTLATADERQPSARMVLLYEFDEGGFVFYTSYASRKGRELAQNPRASLVFWWGPLFRQVRLEGRVTRLEEATCDRYFSTRPREHQLESWAFHQSQVIKDRASLIRRYQTRQRQFHGQKIPRPAEFGGYRLDAERIEFWQGRLDWLHDSLRYTRQPDGSWMIERLAP